MRPSKQRNPCKFCCEVRPIPVWPSLTPPFLSVPHPFRSQIINISGKSQRLHVMPPTTPYFRMEYDNKKGLVPPGLAEAVIVHFSPTEYRYYYDCIRVRCDKQVSQRGADVPFCLYHCSQCNCASSHFVLIMSFCSIASSSRTLVVKS